MGDEQARSGKPFDPMDPWRGMRDAYLDVWAKAMTDVVNSEAYAQATGAMLDSYLTASSPFREAVEKTMLKVLEQMSMPSRSDFVSLAERMTNVEMRLDDMDAKLDHILQLVSRTVALRADEAAKRSSPTASENLKGGGQEERYQVGWQAHRLSLIRSPLPSTDSRHSPR